MTTKPPLDKKALEAAAKASWDAGYADDRPTSAWEDFNALDVPQDDTDGKIAADHRKATTLSINAYLDAADLVPRWDLDEAINRAEASEYNFGFVLKERDEARREANDYGELCEHSKQQRDELYKQRQQMAALRGAAQDLLNRLADYHKKHLPEWGSHEDQECEGRLITILTDTAEATRGYQLVEWQPIATAPKTGGNFISYDSGLVRITFWDKAHGGVWSKWPARATISPTHWMPLPAGPTATPAPEDG